MIHRCETCPFWLRFQTDKPNWGTCDKIESGPPPGTVAGIDHDGVNAKFETHQSFGCVMHPINKATA